VRKNAVSVPYIELLKYFYGLWFSMN